MFGTDFQTRNQLQVLIKCNDRELTTIYNETIQNMNCGRPNNMDSSCPILMDGDFGYTLYKQVESVCTMDSFLLYLHKEMARRFADNNT